MYSLLHNRVPGRQCGPGSNTGLQPDLHVPVGNATDGRTGEPNDVRRTGNGVRGTTLRASDGDHSQTTTGSAMATGRKDSVYQFLPQVFGGWENDSEGHQHGHPAEGKEGILLRFYGTFSCAAFVTTIFDALPAVAYWMNYK